jgi:putative hydrolase of the HAD superfamily
MIRTIISDLGNVLLHFDHMRACRELAPFCRLSPEGIYDAMFGSTLVEEYDLGRISSYEFGRLCRQRLALDIGNEAVRRIWSDIFRPVEGMDELICSLADKYTLVLLSNTNEWHFEHCLETYPVVRRFDRYALSYRLGCRKPDPRIYREALAMAGALPEEALYFDDIPGFVEAAARLGLKAVRFESRVQLLRELNKEGIVLL